MKKDESLINKDFSSKIVKKLSDSDLIQENIDNNISASTESLRAHIEEVIEKQAQYFSNQNKLYKMFLTFFHLL
jgi:hypothetical protein